MTERAIIDGCRRGDRVAQQALYALTSERVYRLLLRMTRHEQDAFDLAQETYLRAFDRIAQFDGGSTLATWIYRIAVNEALQFMRRKRVRLHDLRERQAQAARYAEPGGEDLRLDMHEALDRLAEDERTLIVLKYFEGLGYNEIAGILDKPAGTVASSLNRARQNLRRLLEPRPESKEETPPVEHLI